MSVGGVGSPISLRPYRVGTHQERVNTKAFYCTFAADPGPNPAGKELSEQLDC